jgi:hypothetical protein
MDFLIVFIIGFALGWYLQSWIGAQAFYNILKDLNIPDDKIMALAEKDGVDISKYATDNTVEQPKNSIDINVERHNGRLYAYRSSDNEFLCYGDTPEQLFSEVLKRDPGLEHVNVEQGAEHVKDYVDGLERA